MSKSFATVVSLFAFVLLTTLSSVGFAADPSRIAESDDYGVETVESQLLAFETILAELKNHYGMIQFKDDVYATGDAGLYSVLKLKYQKLIKEATTLEEQAGLHNPETREVLPPDEFRQLMIGFANEFHDGHTNILRNSSRYYTLGMKAAAIQERLYVTGFWPELMPAENTPVAVEVGDEIIALDDKPVLEIAHENLLYTQRATYDTALQSALEATCNVSHRFYRSKIEGDSVKVTFFRKKAGVPMTFTGTFHWVDIKDYSDIKSLVLQVAPKGSGKREYVFGESQTQSFFSQGVEKMALPSGSVTKIGALLNLEIEQSAGTETTEKKDKKLERVDRLSAYTVRYQNKIVGVIRIPGYSPSSSAEVEKELLWLAEIVKRFEASTDALIIDQVHNGGGYVSYATRLVKLFAGDQKIFSGVSMNMRLSDYLLRDRNYTSGDDMNSPKSYTELKLEDHVRKKLKEKVARGERWSGPMPYMGTSVLAEETGFGQITSYGVTPYTKPILILNDSRSASGGDFMPAIMQANKRAYVFGETSMGLGGPVYRSVDAISQAEMFMRCTMGFCLRSDNLPIENIGVVPDIMLNLRPHDLSNGFADWAKAALNTAVAMTQADFDPTVYSRKLSEPAAQQVAESSEAAKELRAILAELPQRDEVVPADMLKAYMSLATWMTDNSQKIQVSEWSTIVLPLPDAITSHDVILGSLTTRSAVLDRLKYLQVKAQDANDAKMEVLSSLLLTVVGSAGTDVQIKSSEKYRRGCPGLLSQ